jgi:hypothetical protein
LAFTASVATAQDDLMDKIKQLEIQIQELKTLKEQQSVTEKNVAECMKVVSQEKFCTCVGTNLPRDVSFELYVHTMLTPKELLGYKNLSSEQKQVIDATINTREKCTEKGVF